MKKFFLMVLLPLSAFTLYAQDTGQPRDVLAIVRASRERIQAETTSQRSKMIIRAKNGTTSERLIDQYSKEGPMGLRTVIVFHEPASVAGTRFLTMENAGGEDDRLIYLPKLRQVRRIAASDGSSSFVGTDFSYDDISSSDRDVGLDAHTLLREEEYGGSGCYVIQSTPKDRSYQYSKMILWIDKNTGVTLKLELHDKKGVLAKVAEMSGLRDVQGRLTVTVTKMTTLAAGTSTTITTDIIKYDDPIPEKVFTREYLETGKVR